MAVTARLSLNLSASQTLPTSEFISGGVNYGINGLDQAFASTDVDSVYVGEFTLAQGVETVLDLSDMNGGNDALGNAYAAGSIVAIIVQLDSGLVDALPQKVLVRGLGGAGNETPLESDANRVALTVWTAPAGYPVTSAPELRFDSVNGASQVAVFVLTKTGTGSTVGDAYSFASYEARHVELDGALQSWFFRIPAGHIFVPHGVMSVIEDAALAVGGTQAQFAVGYSADGVTETTEYDDNLQPDANTRAEFNDFTPGVTMPNGTGWVYIQLLTASGNAKLATVRLHGYLQPY